MDSPKKVEQKNPLKGFMSHISRKATLAIIVFSLLIAGTFAFYCVYTYRPRAFVHRWIERFRTVDNLDAAKRLEQSAPVYLRTFPSGEWFIATCEHSCCSGAGFDATIIRDTTGSIYVDTTYTFCGIEGMSGEFNEHRVPATSLAEFYGALPELKLKKQ